jgi:peptidyl-prolyl isomerase E (cyclophilin E)
MDPPLGEPVRPPALPSANRKLVYVGGLEEYVREKELAAAFVPFGEVKDVQIPLDVETGAWCKELKKGRVGIGHSRDGGARAGGPRGFGFVEFYEERDAAAAIENMDGAELYGRVLKVNVARPTRIGDSEVGGKVKSAADWYEGQVARGAGDRLRGGRSDGSKGDKE